MEIGRDTVSVSLGPILAAHEEQGKHQDGPAKDQ